jgi:hypothetical protein
MRKIRIFVFTYFKWLFPLLLVSCIITAIWVLKNDGCLKSVNSPRSILSLESTFSKEKSDSIITFWNKDKCYCYTASTKDTCDDNRKCNTALVYATKSIKRDYLFICLYVPLLLILLLRFNCRNPFPSFFEAQNDIDNEPPKYIGRLTGIMMVLVLIAGVSDIIENAAMLRAFDHINSYHPESFTIPATIKMILLGMVLVYLLTRSSAWLTDFAVKTGRLLWRFRIAVFSLLLLALPLWFTSQGQDLLANVNSNDAGPVGLFITLSILAVLNWHLPKMYTGTEIQKGSVISAALAKSRAFRMKHLLIRDWDDSRNKNVAGSISYEEKAGRMFGILTFLIPSCAISKLQNVFKVDHDFKFISPVALLALLVLIFYAIIRYNSLERLRGYVNNNIKNIRGITIIILIVAFIVWAFIKIISPAIGSSTGPKRITQLQVNLIYMAALFLLFTEYRSIRRLSNFFTGTSLNWFIWAGAATSIAIFLLFNIAPLLLQKINNFGSFKAEPLPMLISAIIFHTVFFSLLLLWGRRFKTDIISIFLITGLVITLTGSNNFHTVRIIKKDEASLPATSLTTFKDHLKGWLQYRENELKNFDTTGGRRYPFFLINSYGGGIRATAWTSMLLSRVNTVLASKKNSISFKNLPRDINHYTFATSGISGGTVGLALNTSLLYRQWSQPGTIKGYPSENLLSEFYQSDFLSPVTTPLLGRDILASVLGISTWSDRGAIQEQVWEQQAEKYGFGRLDSSFRRIWNKNSTPFCYEIPLLFSNTYHTEKGAQGILAPVKLDSAAFPSATIINAFWPEKRSSDTLLLIRDNDMRLSTAAFISARFPYLSPSARFGYEHHFIDGGTKEYSGCGTLYNIFKLIEKIRKEDPYIDSLMKKIQVYHFNIKNYVPAEDKKVVTNPFEITLPVIAIINTGYGNTDESVERMKQAVGTENSFMVQPTVEFIGQEKGCKNRYSPILPLGWKISDKALERMWKGIGYEQTKAGSDLQKLLQVFD